MKTMLKSIALFCVTLTMALGFASCSKDTDPADVDLFTGTYKGTITYTSISPLKNITAKDGQVIVTKVGDSYSFFFNNGIPDLKNIKVKQKDANTIVSLEQGIKGFTITNATLNMFFVKDGATWTANCKR